MTQNTTHKGENKGWEVVIGLEVHAQITAKTKLFDGCSTEFGVSPNTQVGFFTAAMPGMLPILNKVCVNQAIKTGFGLHATINPISLFDRKNYFYADLPSGYQISQFTHPIVSDGYLDIDLEDGQIKRVGITRLHLEMDAGKSIHDALPGKTCLDFNRSGVALMEIVSEPDLRSPGEAMAYVKKLRALLRYLGTCDGNMEQGSLRVDANISLHRPGTPLGTRAEIKNLNSIRFLGQALEYEIQRQGDILNEGGQISQETRLFDVGKGITRSMRSKENAHDYRYFPDPDLPILRLSSERIEAIRQTLPELPDEKKHRFMEDFGLSSYDAYVLTNEKETADFYESAIQASQTPDKPSAAKHLANWLMGDVFGTLNREGKSIKEIPFPSSFLAELIDLILNDTISGKIAKDVFLKLWETGTRPLTLVENLGLKQITDLTFLDSLVSGVLEQNPQKVEEYKAGKSQLFGFFIGLLMKATQGKANPQIINDLLRKKLDTRE